MISAVQVFMMWINLHQQDLVEMWGSNSPRYLLKYKNRDCFDNLEEYTGIVLEKAENSGGSE